MRYRKAEFDRLPEFWRVYIMGLENAMLSVETQYMSILGPEILKRRKEQDAVHGGADHDDTHTPEDWCRFIQDYAYRAMCALTDPTTIHESADFGIVELVPHGCGVCGNWDEYESRMFDVAALAVAAIQSCRRKNHPWRVDPATIRIEKVGEK